MVKKRLVLLGIIVIVFGSMVIAVAGRGKEILADVPETVDPAKNYLFYMHGAWIEMRGLNRPHPHHGDYKYDEIVNSISRKGFFVISEARLERVGMYQYAKKVAGQVRRLLSLGVPAENITVIGHSKGGHMALLVATILGEDKINIVVMAGCGRSGTRFRRGYDKFLRNHAAQLHGRILSILDAADNVADSCQESFKKVPQLESKEVMFHTGMGHGLFYSPESIWINEVVKWAGM